MRPNRFTIGAVDNIDIDPSSTTAMSSFHGTAASLHQKVIFEEEETTHDLAPLPDGKFLKKLPSSYTEIEPAYLPSTVNPTCDVKADQIPEIKANTNIEDIEWLEMVRLVVKDESEERENISWAAHNASKDSSLTQQADQSAMLPMWRDSSKCPAMIRHAMNKILEATEYLNPGQTAVVAMDQPLYAIGKKIQWHNPNGFGKDFVLMMGPLHIEMAYLGAIGSWLERIGWSILMTNAGVVRPGVAESLHSGKDVRRTKYSHQVTIYTLYVLLKEGYDKAMEKREEKIEFESWCKKTKLKNPLFRYWYIAYNMELSFLLLLKSIRGKE